MSVFGSPDHGTSPLPARLSRRQMLKRGAAGLAAGLVAVSAPAQASPASQAPSDVPADRLTAALATLDTLAQQTLARTGMPGLAIAVVHGDQQVFAKGYGVRTAGTGETVDADTVFRLASVSKPVSSTLTAALVGDGRVGWDTRISDLLPEVELYDPWVTHELTIRDCLCHRSGLPAYGGDELVELGYDRATVLHRLRFMRPSSSMRTQFAYNNIVYGLGNLAAARAAQLDWEDACVERLLKPLGMSRTSTRYADFLATPNHAIEHVRVDGTWVHAYTSDVTPYAPAGNISSSVNDMSRWLRLHLGMGSFEGRQLIPAEALGETHRPQIVWIPAEDPNAPPVQYCLGWGVRYDAGGTVELSHSGSFSYGGATRVILWPAEALGIVILSNAFPIGVVEGLAASFGDLALRGALSRDWLAYYEEFAAAIIAAGGGGYDYTVPPANPTPALPNAAYVGSYGNDLYGPISVVEQNGGLVLQAGPRPQAFALTHYDHDVFTYPLYDAPTIRVGTTFKIGPDGLATSVVIDAFNSNGQGVWTRSETAA